MNSTSSPVSGIDLLVADPDAYFEQAFAHAQEVVDAQMRYEERHDVSPAKISVRYVYVIGDYRSDEASPGQSFSSARKALRAGRAYRSEQAKMSPASTVKVLQITERCVQEG